LILNNPEEMASRPAENSRHVPASTQKRISIRRAYV
jgi:hypothetical protein